MESRSESAPVGWSRHARWSRREGWGAARAQVNEGDGQDGPLVLAPDTVGSRQSSIGGRGFEMTAYGGDRRLWQVGEYVCVMISCCSGAELQIRRRDAAEDVVLRELYPTKTDLFERARALEGHYRFGAKGSSSAV